MHTNLFSGTLCLNPKNQGKFKTIKSKVERLPSCEKQGKHPCSPEQDVGCLNNEKSEIL